MPNDDTTPVEIEGRIWESDLDLALVLDAAERGPASALLIAAVGLKGDLMGVERSAHRGTDGRETDVVLKLTDGEIHVEHKIDARLGDGQAASYAAHRDHADGGEGPGTVKCILVAPSRHLPGHKPTSTSTFDEYVSCAAVAEAAAVGGGLGRAVSLVYSKAEQIRMRPDDDPLLVEWGDQYRALLTELGGDHALLLSPGSLRRSNEAQFVLSPEMRTDVTRPDGEEDRYVWKFAHHVTGGRVQIELAPSFDVDPATLPAPLELNPEGGLSGSKRTQCHVRVRVPELETATSPADQREAVAAVVEAAIALREWAHSYIASHQRTSDR